MRTGPELVRASNEYAKEDRALTWRLLVVSLLVWAAAVSVAAFGPLWIAVPASLLTGLIVVRLFIFYHDYLHGAILGGSRVGGWIMRAVGYYVLAGPSVWKETHDYHHKHTAKMVGAAIGSYPVVTVGMWHLMSRNQQLAYRFVRNPLTMLFGYVFMFVLGMCISPFKRQPRQHLDGLLSLVFQWTLAALAGWAFGWQAALLGVLLPDMVATASGSYLFYAQHNFPGMQIRGRREWEYTFAALHSSSMFDMNPVMHWLTGNIGYHHVHHLNHRIPFYRLPEAMAGMPELQNPHRTSWALRDIRACLRFSIWSPEDGRMITYAEAEARRPNPDDALAAK
jgi:acyl-lipid omega-6 desaturase (Delta-12 desaturase)